jgi:hypothetical protein
MPATRTRGAWAASEAEMERVSEERQKEEFLSRWSRLKQQAREVPAAPQPAAPDAKAAEAPPELPPVEELGMDSDYRGFFHPKVNEDLRRTALKKLFSDPHFNVMDGLDTYIDDYSKPDPLPAAMLAQLRQAQKIIEWANDKGEKKEEGQEQGQARIAAAAAAAPEVPSAVSSEIPAISGRNDDAMPATDLSAPAGAAVPEGKVVVENAVGPASGKSQNVERDV